MNEDDKNFAPETKVNAESKMQAKDAKKRDKSVVPPNSIMKPGPNQNQKESAAQKETSLATTDSQKEASKEIAKAAEKELENLAIGMYPSYVLSKSMKPEKMGPFYDSNKRVYESLTQNFKDVVKISYHLFSEDERKVFQGENEDFESLACLLEDDNGDLKPGYNVELKPWSHVEYRIDGLVHINVSYEEHSNPIELYELARGRRFSEKVTNFIKENERKRDLKQVLVGGITGAFTGAAFFSGLWSALIFGVGGSVANLGVDLLRNPVFYTTVECELEINSKIPIENRSSFNGYFDEFMRALDEECLHSYNRDSNRARLMREYIKKKAKAANIK